MSCKSIVCRCVGEDILGGTHTNVCVSGEICPQYGQHHHLVEGLGTTKKRKDEVSPIEGHFLHSLHTSSQGFKLCNLYQ